MLQAELKHEVTQFLERSSYQGREDDQAAHRNGYKQRTVASGEGASELYTP